MKTIDYKIDKDGVAILTIDVKDRSMNVMTPAFLQDLSDAVDKVAGDDKVKGAVITSAKDSFMAVPICWGWSRRSSSVRTRRRSMAGAADYNRR